MNLHELLAHWSAWWWPLVAAHLWQSTLFFAAVAIAVLLLRDASAAARRRAWLIGSLKFALPALFLTGPLGWLGLNGPSLERYVTPPLVVQEWISTQPSVVSSQLSAVSRQPGGHNELYCLLSLAWFAGLAFLGVRWLRSSRRLACLVSKGRTSDNPALLIALEQAKLAVGMKRSVLLRVCPDIGSPAAYGILRPVILVPCRISDTLHPAELEAVLMHELVHVRRFDNLLAAFQRLLCWFFWFHPLVWLLDRRLLGEQELSCDQAVVAHSGQPRAYAAGILKISRFSFRASPAGVSLASGSSLGRRIRMITGQNPQRSRWLHHLVLAGLASTLVVVSLAVAPPSASEAAQTSAGQELKRGACPECPVTLLEANLKAEEPAGPTIQVRNDANRPVKYFYLVLENRTTNQKAYFRVSETLEPGETKTVAVRSQRAMVPIEEAPNRYRLETVGAAEARQRVGDLAQVETKVPTVVFADNSSFALKGYLPAPPPPPPVPAAPPAPPAPPAPSDREAPRALPTVPAPPTPPPAPPVPPETDEQYMGGVVGGVPGGVKGGVVGGVVGGVPGGVKGGVAGGVVGGVPGGVVGGVPGGVVGGVPAPAKKRARKPNPAPVPKPAAAPESKPAPAPAPAPNE